MINIVNSDVNNSETKIHDKGTFGWLREQAKKDCFDNIKDWQNWKRYRNIKNIDQVENILEENNVCIKDIEIFYRFWDKVDIKNNKEECWNWIANTNDGYGNFHMGYKNRIKTTTVQMRSNRMAYILTKEDIPDGLQVLHLCNNSLCCNPNHLELGDNIKNMQYMVKCGRCNQSGENNGNSILTEDQVREIHKIYDEQRKLHPEFFRKQWKIIEPIAKKFGVDKITISRIICGKNWSVLTTQQYDDDTARKMVEEFIRG